MEQRTPEWDLARSGSLGASRIAAALSRLKRSGERTAAAMDCMLELAAEQLTGVPAKQSNPRSWGLEYEDEARRAYAFLTNLPVVKVAIIPHPTIPDAHASPDSLVGDEGGLEIKCPTSATHLRTLLDRVVPEEHIPQLFWAMACSGRAWWDFVSYDPRFPPHLQFFQTRLERNDTIIAGMENEAREFLGEVGGKLAKIDELYP